MDRQYCHFHADDDIAGVRLNDEGGYTFTCERATGHPTPGPYAWFRRQSLPIFRGCRASPRSSGCGCSSLLLPGQHPGRWVEYGVVEAAYAEANPADFARLVERYGHTAIKAKNYTASAFIAATLGRLSRSGDVLFHAGPATGRWDYNQQISWWSLAPDPDWATRTAGEASRSRWSTCPAQLRSVPRVGALRPTRRSVLTDGC